jgi:hypothetical protein
MSDVKERDDQQQEKDDNTEPQDQLTAVSKAAAKLASSGGNVEVPADALYEAVGQLKQLTALRQQEAERQERAIGEMQVAIQRQGKTNGWMVILSLVLLVVAGAGVYFFDDLREATDAQSQDIVQVGQQVSAEFGRQTEFLNEMEGRVEATRQAVTEEVGRQAETLVDIEQAVTATRSEQAERLAAVEAEFSRSLTQVGDEQVAAMATVREAVEVAQRQQAERLANANEEVTRTLTEVASGQTVALVSVNDQVSALREQLVAAQAENAELTQMMDGQIRAAEAAIADRVEESVAAVRAERDEVLAEMGRLLEQRMAQLDAREGELEQRQAALVEEEERFARQAAASRERMRALLNDALETLTPSAALAAPAVAETVEQVPPPQEASLESAVVEPAATAAGSE